MGDEPEAREGDVVEGETALSPAEAEVRAMDLFSAAATARGQQIAEDARTALYLSVLAFMKRLHEIDGTVRMGHQPSEQIGAEGRHLVWIQAPQTGQLSWHIPKDLIPDWLPERSTKWPEQTETDRNERLADYIGLCPSQVPETDLIQVSVGET